MILNKVQWFLIEFKNPQDKKVDVIFFRRRMLFYLILSLTRRVNEPY